MTMTPTLDRVAQLPDHPVIAARVGHGHRILFVKLGSFSHTNERILEQLKTSYPNYEIVTFDVKDYIKTKFGLTALNALLEVITYGPSVLSSASQRHAFFFLTPFMFRHLSAAIVKQFGPEAESFKFVLQTQGLFKAALPGRPFIIYTDHTLASHREYPHSDRRLFRSKALLRLERELYLSADRIVVAAAHVEQTLVRTYGCDPQRVATIMIGANVDIRPVSTELARYAAKQVLFVGVEWERKGGPALVEGFRQAAKDHPEAHLTIVGCSPAISDPRITVAGSVPRARMSSFYESASIFCMPSLIEPLGIAVVEASLFRLPVIATQVGGFFETVTDGETGFLVPPNDPAAIAAALRKLFDAPDIARRMGLAGFDRNRSRFDWNEVGKRLRAIAETIPPA